jgi:Family of unknown function (DUF5723)
MKKSLLVAVLTQRTPLAAVLALAVGFPAHAQNELTNFTSTGRGGAVNAFATEFQALGINPANLGRATGVKVAFTIGEFGVGMSSQTAPRSVFNDYIFNTEKQFPRNPDGTDVGSSNANPIGPERQKVINAFTGKNVANVQMDFTALAISYYHPTIGGFAINTRYRMIGSADLSKNAAEMIFAGNNATIIREGLTKGGEFPKVSAALKDTRIQIQAVQEFNIGYGRQLFEGEGMTLSGGIGYRYLRGIGILDVQSDGKTLSAYGALSPVFDASYPTSLIQTAQFGYKTDAGTSAKFPSVGSGNAIDIGLAATVAGKYHLSASVVDIGKMTWKANSVSIIDQQLQPFGQTPDELEFNGDYNGPITYNFWKSMKRFQVNSDGQTSPFQYQAAGERKVSLPTRMRLGAGTDFGEKLSVGIDGLLPFDNKIAGSYRSALIGAGVTYKPVSWLHLSTGLSGGGGFGTSVPLGIAIVTKSYEGGLATRDITGYFGEEKPYLSLVGGFLRFKIGKPQNDM